MHKLLQRQLHRMFGGVEGVPDELRPFLEVVDRTYRQADEDRALLEHSMATASEELVERNRQLREERARYRALSESRSLGSIFERAAVGLMVLDLQGKVLHANEALQDLLGYAEGELAGRPATALTPEDDEATLVDALGRVLKRGVESAELEERFFCRDGRLVPVWLTLSLVASDDGEPLYVMGLVQDVSERNRMRDTLRQREQELRQALKMEAVGRLAGGVAHDFNNILTVIQGHTTFLLEALPAGDASREDALQIQDASRRAQSLTRQLLAFSRKQILMPTVLDLNEVLGGMEPLLRRLIGEDVVVRTETTPGIGAVVADRGQIEQVIMNLVVNARDAMPGGGHLTLATRARELDEPDPPVPAGRYLELSVRDTGVGIAESLHHQVFEPFFTTKEPGRGTGLGLAMVYGIVKQSGGYVFFDSEAEVGTEFRVLLPRVDREPEGSEAPARSPIFRGSGTILLVEDDAAVQEVAFRILQGAGYTVLRASDGVAALRRQRHHGGRIDLVLTDVVMPNMGGRALVERLRAHDGGIGVVYMSGHDDDAEVVHRGLMEEDTVFVQKPFDRATLLGAVSAELGRTRGVGREAGE